MYVFFLSIYFAAGIEHLFCTLDHDMYIATSTTANHPKARTGSRIHQRKSLRPIDLSITKRGRDSSLVEREQLICSQLGERDTEDIEFPCRIFDVISASNVADHKRGATHDGISTHGQPQVYHRVSRINLDQWAMGATTPYLGRER